MAAGLLLRTWPPADHVFTAHGVVFQASDPWYHVRRVEHLAHHFPHVIEHDPYALAPDGQDVAVAPLLDWIAAGVALAWSAGVPSRETVHAVCAWLPPILGVLIVPCVYSVSRLIFGRAAGALAAAIAATLPGPFLARSLLGCFDHHVAEALFSTLTMFALLAALRAGAPAERGTPAGRSGSRYALRRPFVRSLFAGVAMSAYLLSWVGGSLLVFVVFLAVALQLVQDHLRGRDTSSQLLTATLPCFLTAIAIVAPFHSLPGFDLHVAALSGGIAGLGVLAAVSRALRRRGTRAVWVIPSVVAMTVVGIGLGVLLVPSVCDRVRSMVLSFASGPAAGTVSEAAPLPATTPVKLFTSLWTFFSTNGLFATAALIALWVAVIRRGRPDHTLLAVWTTLVLLAMLKQRRFAYYAAVNVAILSPAALVWFTRAVAARSRRSWRRSSALKASAALAALAVTLAPNVPLALRTAREHTGPSADWRAALDWLRENTPEPFGDPTYYFADYQTHSDRTLRAGVMCWWDEGYWLTQRARRVPAANPTQAGAEFAARFFTATDEASAVDLMRQIRGTHVIVDESLPLRASNDGRSAVGKFRYLPFWAGGSLGTFTEEMRLRTKTGRLEPVTVYHPAYYRTMCARLYTFGGRAFVPENATWLIAVEPPNDGDPRPIIRERRRFATYEEAGAFVTAHADASWRIVGFTPYRSCVPLEKLGRFRRAYHSPTPAATRGAEVTGRVEIYELTSGPTEEGGRLMPQLAPITPSRHNARPVD